MKEHHFLSYSGDEGYIKEKIQTFKVNYSIFEISKKDIKVSEIMELLNNGYNCETSDSYYTFYLPKLAIKLDSGLGKHYFSKWRK